MAKRPTIIRDLNDYPARSKVSGDWHGVAVDVRVPGAPVLRSRLRDAILCPPCVFDPASAEAEIRDRRERERGSFAAAFPAGKLASVLR